jgi:hypothetical protein
VTSPPPVKPTLPHHWPDQAARALRGLIHAANTARAGGQSAMPADVSEPLILELRRAVRVGLAQIPRIAGPAKTTRQTDGRLLLECLHDREGDVLRLSPTPGSGRRIS